MHVEIAGRRVGDGTPLFVIAELGLNHGGSLARALEMVDAAADAGASAVKLQTFRAADLVAGACPAPAHVPEPSLQAFFARFELDRDAHAAVARRARAHGLAFMSTPFSCEAVDMLADLGADALKIASGDLTYDALIARAAATGLPLVMSTGMASLADTAHAVDVARAAGARQLALMHCVSAYPVAQASQNLRAIRTLAETFHVPAGLSDHAADTAAVPLVVALGGSLYERHMMLPGDDGVDAAVSSTPDELAAAIVVASRTGQALGHGRRECLPAEAGNVVASRRSLHATRRLEPGHVIADGDLRALRPATGIAPSHAATLVGAVVGRTVDDGTPLMPGDVRVYRSDRGAA
jgi:N,N'-diacetyllegionaminate synthase